MLLLQQLRLVRETLIHIGTNTGDAADGSSVLWWEGRKPKSRASDWRKYA